MLKIFLFTFVSVAVACPQSEKREYQLEREYRPKEYYRGREYGGNYLKCPCSTPKVVGEFNKYFAEEVKSDEQLTSVFNGAKNITREEFSAALFYLVSVISEQTGYDKPTERALETIKNIALSCKRISPDLLLSVYSNTAAKRLNEEEKLCSSNARVLAQSYARYAKDSAESIAGEDCPRSKIQAVITALGDFLRAQDLYTPDNEIEIARVFSDEWKCRDWNVTAKEKCAIACYSPEKPALEVCDNVCKIENIAVEKFVNAFRGEVKNCEVLSNMFHVEPPFTPAMFSRGTFYIALHYNTQDKAENPRELADFSSRFIKDVELLKPSIVERVHLRFLGKHLLSEEILNCQNAEKLAEMYANIAKKKAELIVDSRDDRSKVVAIQTSWRRFLQSLDAISRDNAEKIAYLYGNEWRCEA